MPDLRNRPHDWGKKSVKELAEINAFREEYDLPPVKQGIITCTCGQPFYSPDWYHVRYCPKCKAGLSEFD